MRLTSDKEAKLPNLREEDYQVMSPEDWGYNCIAHAANKNDVPWWPMEEGTEGVFWPEGVPRKETLDAFIAAFGTQKYVLCEGPELEAGFEKIALYTDENGTPTHAARQLPLSGAWISKLGDWEDIEHKSLASLEAEPGGEPAYGKAICFMKRPISESAELREVQPSQPADANPADSDTETGTEG
jgi:hypothetical protein